MKILASVALLVVAVQAVGAQKRDAVAVDFTVGTSTASGGDRLYDQADAVGAQLTIAGVRPRAGALAAVGALSFGARNGLIYNNCRIDPQHPQGCAPVFPSFVSAGALGGVEVGGTNATARLLVGLAYYAASGSDGFGGQVNLSASVGLRHAALVGSVRREIIRRLNGETLHVSGLQFGLRFQ